MKKTQVAVTLAGLLVLTGCTKPVMQDNRYIPAKDDQAVGASRQYDDFGSDNKTYGSIPPASADSQAAPAQPRYDQMQQAPAQPRYDQAQQAPAQQAPAQQTRNNGPYCKYAPMEDVKSSGGISDSRPARKAGKKGRRTAGKAALPKGGIYVVKSGDYPAKIAKKFGVSVSALLEANKMTMDDAKKLQIGQKLTIPAKGAAKGKKVNKKTAGKTEVKVEAGVYVVRSGDVPARIARRLKVKLADLLKANNMTLEDAKKLQIGQKLVVPGKGVQKQEVAKKDVTTEKKTKQDAQKQEVKEKNEDLDSADQIAKKIEENPADDKNNFDDGGEPYEIAEDTTFRELAVKLNIPEAKLRSMNTDITGDNLPKSSCVMIPSKK